MTEFTDDELRFLAHHGVSPDEVYDGRFQSTWLWKMRAKEEGKELVLGSRCRARGHRLRTRAGHCVQCDPRKIAYLRRYSSPGFVYIAGSLEGRVLKIETGEDAWDRVSRLSTIKYAGFDDWTLVAHVGVTEGGKVEASALALLYNYRTSRLYTKDGSTQEAIELLRSCPFSVAVKALGEAAEGFARTEIWVSRHSYAYEFPSAHLR